MHPAYDMEHRAYELQWLAATVTAPHDCSRGRWRRGPCCRRVRALARQPRGCICGQTIEAPLPARTLHGRHWDDELSRWGRLLVWRATLFARRPCARRAEQPVRRLHSIVIGVVGRERRLLQRDWQALGVELGADACVLARGISCAGSRQHDGAVALVDAPNAWPLVVSCFGGGASRSSAATLRHGARGAGCVPLLASWRQHRQGGGAIARAGWAWRARSALAQRRKRRARRADGPVAGGGRGGGSGARFTSRHAVIDGRTVRIAIWHGLRRSVRRVRGCGQYSAGVHVGGKRLAKADERHLACRWCAIGRASRRPERIVIAPRVRSQGERWLVPAPGELQLGGGLVHAVLIRRRVAWRARTGELLGGQQLLGLVERLSPFARLVWGQSSVGAMGGRGHGCRERRERSPSGGRGWLDIGATGAFGTSSRDAAAVPFGAGCACGALGRLPWCNGAGPRAARGVRPRAPFASRALCCARCRRRAIFRDGSIDHP